VEGGDTFVAEPIGVVSLQISMGGIVTSNLVTIAVQNP
jgi:hypothetical protein